jgi:hypothetical protein
MPPRVPERTPKKHVAVVEWARKLLRETTSMIPRTRYPSAMIKTDAGRRAARVIAEWERKRDEAIDWALKRVAEMVVQCHKSPPIQASGLSKRNSRATP